MSRGDVPAVPDDAREAGALASELARAYRRMAMFYRDQLQLTGPDADDRARGNDDSPAERAADLARIRERPPDQVSWFDLTRVAERDPDTAAAIWRDVKAAARDELHTGHRAAQALDWEGGPWQRARFLAIRDGFRADTPPRTGIESALLDMAAEAFGDYLEWTEHLHMQATSEVKVEQHDLDTHGEWRPARLSMADAMEQSARMAERAHLRMLRTVKALSDLRRAGPVYVSRAGQVNVGQQQINVATPPGQPSGEPDDSPE